MKTNNEESKNKILKKNSLHDGHRERMRNKILKYGIESFTEYEVLETMLFNVFKRQNTNELAHELIEKFGSLKGVLNADYSDLMAVRGAGEKTANFIVLLREFNQYVNTHEFDEIILDTSKKVGRFCCNYFKHHIEESFIIIALDDYNRIRCVDVISKGNAFETAVYKDKVVKSAIFSKTRVIILAHNHPGASCEPSANDVYVTDMLAKSLGEFNIIVRDHIICSDDEFVSLSDRGILKH